MNPAFWRGKRVFLTGHTGFKGSWLALWLQQAGAQILGVALAPPTQPNLFDMAQIAQGMESELLDIRNAQALRAAMQRFEPEVVLHLAAQSVVKASYDDPVSTYATNVMGTVHLLEAVRLTPGVRSVVVVSSDKCYENREWVWGYRESDPMGGHDPYSNSKGCTELVTASYRDSFFSNQFTAPAVGSGRAGNVIGGGDWTANQLIPDAIRAFSACQEVLLRSPKAVRPWQFVLEPLDGYLTLAEHLFEHGQTYAEGWNFGPSQDHAKTVQWIVERLTLLWGPPARWGLDPNHHPHEAGLLSLDSSKALARLNWRCKLDLPTTLQWTVEWYKALAQGQDMRRVTMNQIDRYQALSRPEQG